MYQFRREDNGKIVELEFTEMMEQDAAGYVTLKDGVRAKRVHDGNPIGKPAERRDMAGAPILPSDSLGFTERQLAAFEADRVKHGFTGVEFVRDPHYDKFFQVKCSSRGEWRRYMKHREYVDNNPSSGAALSPEGLEKAKEVVMRKYGGNVEPEAS